MVYFLRILSPFRHRVRLSAPGCFLPPQKLSLNMLIHPPG